MLIDFPFIACRTECDFAFRIVLPSCGQTTASPGAIVKGLLARHSNLLNYCVCMHSLVKLKSFLRLLAPTVLTRVHCYRFKHPTRSTLSSCDGFGSSQWFTGFYSETETRFSHQSLERLSKSHLHYSRGSQGLLPYCRSVQNLPLIFVWWEILEKRRMGSLLHTVNCMIKAWIISCGPWRWLTNTIIRQFTSKHLQYLAKF